jgi:hypothetical protein
MLISVWTCSSIATHGVNRSMTHVGANVAARLQMSLKALSPRLPGLVLVSAQYCRRVNHASTLLPLLASTSTVCLLSL